MLRGIVVACSLFLVLLAESVCSQIRIRRAFANLQFTEPVELTHSSDGSNRLFLVEQRGVIYVFPNDEDTPSATVFLDL